MIAGSDVPVDAARAELDGYGVEYGLLVPTSTGLTKSILDAYDELRAFLKRAGWHDYARQEKGQGAKVTVPATVVISDSKTADTKISLYRPETKQGDPRLWISRLPAYADPGNLIALISGPDRIYIVNLSRADVWSTKDRPRSVLAEVLAGDSGLDNPHPSGRSAMSANEVDDWWDRVGLLWHKATGGRDVAVAPDRAESFWPSVQPAQECSRRRNGSGTVLPTQRCPGCSSWLEGRERASPTL